MNKTVRILRFLLITFLTAAICISGYKLWEISEQYIREAQVKDSVLKYRPAENTASAEAEPNTAAESPEHSNGGAAGKKNKNNRFITDLQNDVNKDIIGWITIPNTKIDYPFVISKDNDFYLRRDLYGNRAAAGTLFADYRCAPDFSDFNTIIYGHTMKNGSMFGELKLFAEEGFFESNRFGTIFLKDGTYTIEFFAYMVVRADDNIIYGISAAGAERREFFDYVKKYALNYREPDAKQALPADADVNVSDNINSCNIDSNIVTLSTCSYQYDGARIVLLAVLNPK